MPTLLLEANHLVKYFGDRRILELSSLRVYAGDRIGVVGANGGGKTTLLDLLSGELTPDEGEVRRCCSISYCKQFDPGVEADVAHLGRFGVAGKAGAKAVSGGEATRKRLAQVLGAPGALVFADEPTSNLDAQGVELFCEQMAQVPTFLLISHDRAVLTRLCNKILEVKEGTVTLYDGGFAFYREESARRQQRRQTEYLQYDAERRRLEGIYQAKKGKAASITRHPKNLTPHECRVRNFLTSRSYDAKQKNMERSAAAVKSRLAHLEVKEKPHSDPAVHFDFSLTAPPANRIVLRGQGITFAYGDLRLFENADFSLENGSKTALIGKNGAGKTTLLHLISRAGQEEASCIHLVPKARVGYFYQGFENLDLNRTVLENAMEGAVQNEATVRALLARLLFRRDDVYKKAGVLSGGERIKLAFAKLFASPANVLLLDEPTNYLDMPSIEALQQMLAEYKGTVLFVSHDRAFVDAVADRLLLLQNQKLLSFAGNLSAYELSRAQPKPQKQDVQKSVLEFRLTAVLSRLSVASGAEKEALEAEYQGILAQLKALKHTQ